jgi:hypothetical protein
MEINFITSRADSAGIKCSQSLDSSILRSICSFRNFREIFEEARVRRKQYFKFTCENFHAHLLRKISQTEYLLRHPADRKIF